MLAVKSDIASQRRYDLENELETVCVELSPADCSKIIVCVVYRAPNSELNFMDKFSRLLSNILHIQQSICFLLGDYNLPKIEWINNSGFSNSQHEFAFTELLKDNGLFQLNTFPTRFSSTNNSGNILDLLITNEPEMISNIEVHAPSSVDFPSDHSILEF